MGNWNQDLNVFQKIIFVVAIPFIKLGEMFSRNKYENDGDRIRKLNKRFDDNVPKE